MIIDFSSVISICEPFLIISSPAVTTPPLFINFDSLPLYLLRHNFSPALNEPSMVSLTSDISIFLALILLLILTFPDIIISPFISISLTSSILSFTFTLPEILLFSILVVSYTHKLFIFVSLPYTFPDAPKLPQPYIYTLSHSHSRLGIINSESVSISCFLTPLRHNVRLPSNLTFFLFSIVISPLTLIFPLSSAISVK